VFCTIQWMQRHTTSHLNNTNKKIREVHQWGSGGWDAEACTPAGVLLGYLWGLCSMPRLICMIFVADLIACMLNFLMSAVAWCRPVTPRLWSGFLVWLLQMVPVAHSRMVWRIWWCPSKRGISKLMLFSRLFCLLYVPFLLVVRLHSTYFIRLYITFVCLYVCLLVS